MSEENNSEAGIPIFEILIRMNPATQQMQIAMTNEDPVIVVGMLEIAKAQILERHKRKQAEQMFQSAGRQKKQ